MTIICIRFHYYQLFQEPQRPSKQILPPHSVYLQCSKVFHSSQNSSCQFSTSLREWKLFHKLWLILILSKSSLNTLLDQLQIQGKSQGQNILVIVKITSNDPQQALLKYRMLAPRQGRRKVQTVPSSLYIIFTRPILARSGGTCVRDSVKRSLIYIFVFS